MGKADFECLGKCELLTVKMRAATHLPSHKALIRPSISVTGGRWTCMVSIVCYHRLLYGKLVRHIHRAFLHFVSYRNGSKILHENNVLLNCIMSALCASMEEC